jgi:hypothetical protein
VLCFPRFLSSTICERGKLRCGLGSKGDREPTADVGDRQAGAMVDQLGRPSPHHGRPDFPATESAR